ncbi:MAG: hypothetical protein K6F71_07435 [Ruminococcus sp.]|uniref:hypothetical protein n=1 Tax=Ruminococcus sp. TaxID=41978 RepID=UPI0025D02015|nr:hypothetical protein [Ruminococcus sp.]MCR5540634.1 hypothetical protein [Ruminococcus sp.]
MKERYWKFMYQKMHKITYIDLYRERCIWYNRILKCVIALSSSGSVAAWAIWKNHAFIWGLIVAIGQVINILYEILPYRSRITELTALSSKWSVIESKIEHEWYYIQNDLYDDAKINDLITQYTQEWSSIDDYFLKVESLPLKKNIQKKSEKNTKAYFENNYIIRKKEDTQNNHNNNESLVK